MMNLSCFDAISNLYFLGLDMVGCECQYLSPLFFIESHLTSFSSGSQVKWKGYTEEENSWEPAASM